VGSEFYCDRVMPTMEPQGLYMWASSNLFPHTATASRFVTFFQWLSCCWPEQQYWMQSVDHYTSFV